MSAVVAGWGTALPEGVLEQDTALAWLQRIASVPPERRRALAALFRRSGVRRRHTVVRLHDDPLMRPARGVGDPGPGTAERLRRFAVEAPPLAAAAGRTALADAGRPPDRVTHLVTVSCTGGGSPGVDVALVQRLGLPPTTQRAHIGFMGCHGALNGLAVAGGLAASDPGAVVLLCAVELCSLHLAYRGDEAAAVAHALFADGAAAVVLVPDGADATDAGGPDGRWSLAASGTCLLPDSADAMSWTVGDHGFEMGLSPEVPDRLGGAVRDWLATWLDRHGLALDDVASWAVHPGGPRILDAVARALALPRSATEASRDVLARCGNMSSPTVLFVLDELRRRGAPRPCVAMGFGPGLVAEAALFR